MSESLESHAYNCYWVLRKEGLVRVVKWREFDTYSKDWEIVDYFRAKNMTEAQIRAVQHGDLA